MARMTNQRLRIMEYLKKAHHHPTAEQVYTQVKRELPHITLSTVYRNLNLLADTGQIERLELNGEYRYDAQGAHLHFLCRKCNRIHDLHMPEVLAYAMKKAPGNANGVTIIYRGLCKRCEEGKE